MPKNSLSHEAEEKILKAARTVFIKKGYKGATTRDIAAEAGITSPLLNYYFRSKENIFSIVYERAFNSLYSNVYHTIMGDASLFDKIPALVDGLMKELVENPDVPSFIFNEVTRSPEKLVERFRSKMHLLEAYRDFSDSVYAEVEKGTIRPVRPITLLINIQSLCIYPFLARPLLCEISNISIREYMKILARRRDEIIEMIEKDIRIK
ncbi:MAG: TetR/AcrR family transcriptional regulator [Flavobacteriales bacterium]|jgi:AcrR family transcriptional regulator|nr:TetR/AcrR family transcriptional regulator [Flavobacteriales bacterium]